MIKIARIAGILVLGLLGAITISSSLPLAAAEASQLNLDLAVYQIKDQKVRQALGIQAVPIRAKSYTLPAMTLPLLQLGNVSQDQLNSWLREIYRQTSGGAFPGQKIRDLSDIFTLKSGSRIYWINKASGASSFSNNKEVMAIPTNIKDHRQAVEAALRFLVNKNLVALGPHETLDVEFVSQVMNAAVKDGEVSPVTQYGADYFVCFGRRYRDIPIMGSRLILRVGADGKLFGVQKTWRPVVGEGEWVTTMATPQGDQMRNLLLKNPGQANQNIIVHKTVSGYLEGPVKNEQLMMGPGCIVNFTTSPGSEMASKKTIPLASVNFPLTGVYKKFPPAKVTRRDLIPVRDRDDRIKDEEN